MGLIGPIRGKRLPAETKFQICRPVLEAKGAGKTIEWACRVIMQDPRRLRRWLQRAREVPASGLGALPFGASRGL